MRFEFRPLSFLAGAALSALALASPYRRKDLALSGFKTSENVTLNPMFIRPQQITLTAMDDAGKDHTITVPWK